MDGLNLWDYMDDEMRLAFVEDRNRRVGSARQALWECGDGWIVGYTTQRITGGPFDGRFAALAYKPVGKGSRTGAAHEHVRVYYRGYSKMKLAKARAEAMYQQHRV
jgi:hypothetical protein